MKHLWQSVPRMLLAGMATAAVGCAHTSTAVPAASPGPESMVVTGSHIPQPVDARTGYPTTASLLRIHTRDDLVRTGRPEIGPALRQLDTALWP